MNQKVCKVLFVSSGNSGRSVMAEAILGRRGAGRFQAHSAGSHPTGRVNSLALEELRRRGYPTDGLASKSWEPFAGPAATALDVVVTICEIVAAEPPPAWAGDPILATWKLPAPGSVEGTDRQVRAVFEAVCQQIEEHITLFLDLTSGDLDRTEITNRLNAHPAA